MHTNTILATAAALTLVTSAAHAESVTIQVDNLLATDGPSLTPVFLGLHDGTYDLFDPGSAASPGLERTAELGVNDILTDEFDAAPGAVARGSTAGPIRGGTSATLTLEVDDPSAPIYLTYASMVVPSNDLFIGNDDPLAVQLFGEDGGFAGPVTFDLLAGSNWDAGTEVNDITDGAAFVAGIDATLGTEQGGVIDLLRNDPDRGDYLASLIGTETAAGYTIGSAFVADTPIARFTITASGPETPNVIPTPTAAAGTLLLTLLAISRRRRAA